VPWWYAVIESRHELQNPTSPEKIRLLGSYLGLGPGSQVLDLAAGRGGPALALASSYGCRITCIEQASEFASAARDRIAEAGLTQLIEVVEADARDFGVEPERYDAVLCLGASFVWGGLDGALSAMTPSACRGGFVVIGEPYWRRWPLPEDCELEPGEDFVTLAETVERLEAANLELVGLLASTVDDWDRYESLHWLTLENWLRENPDDPDAAAFREQGRRYRERYLLWQREFLGWAIFVGRKP
jgi:precorrin-6B methylase 2